MQEEFQALLQKAAEIDAADAREDRLKALAEANAKIFERVKARAEQVRKDYVDKVAHREAQRQARKKPRGSESKEPKTDPKPNDQINLTDKESRGMPSHEGFVQGYNSQAAVDVDTRC